MDDNEEQDKGALPHFHLPLPVGLHKVNIWTYNYCLTLTLSKFRLSCILKRRIPGDYKRGANKGLEPTSMIFGLVHLFDLGGVVERACNEEGLGW